MSNFLRVTGLLTLSGGIVGLVFPRLGLAWWQGRLIGPIPLPFSPMVREFAGLSDGSLRYLAGVKILAGMLIYGLARCWETGISRSSTKEVRL